MQTPFSTWIKGFTFNSNILNSMNSLYMNLKRLEPLQYVFIFPFLITFFHSSNRENKKVIQSWRVEQ